MSDVNERFEQLNETQLNYDIPVFGGTHTKKKRPYTLKFVDDESGLKKADDYQKPAGKPDYHPKPAGIYPDSLGPTQDDEFINDAMSSTERVRKYYRRHPKKVRAYLRKTQDDRVARNRDRKKAVDKYGEDKMKNHDVHHPNGAQNGSWRLAKKDHGPDKKADKKKRTVAKKAPPKSKPAPKPAAKKPEAPKKVSKQQRLVGNIKKFVKYVATRLRLQNVPDIDIIGPQKDIHSLGWFNPDTKKIHVVVRGRLLADILRTIAHELVHLKQSEMGIIKDPRKDGGTGSDVENQANAVAGIIMRDYGSNNPMIYVSENKVLTEKSEPEEPEVTISETDTEALEPQNPVGIFSGRFQPFHAGHYVTYLEMVKQFGRDNVYVATSDKQDAAGKSPFSFTQKSEIMTKMFNIPHNKVVKVEKPYSPEEITKNLPENTPVVFAVSEKDKDRVNGDYFTPYTPDIALEGYLSKGYVWVKPVVEGKKQLTGMQIRHIFGNPRYTDRAKEQLFTTLYGKFDRNVFDMMTKVSTQAEEDREITMQHKEKHEDDTNEIIFSENEKPVKMKRYLNVREFEPEELANEVGEYFENEKTFKAFPDLAKDKEQLADMIANAPTVTLERDDLKQLGNSEVPSILQGESAMKIMRQFAEEDKPALVRILKAIKAEKDLPMPVVIKHPTGYYLMGGNRRLSVLAAMGKTMPVKLLTYEKQPLLPSTYQQQAAPVDKKGVADTKQEKEMFQRVMQMKITNPATGNQVKIDTAMDYNKQHPAHLLALNTIRHYMKGISSRAGVPKKISYNS